MAEERYAPTIAGGFLPDLNSDVSYNLCSSLINTAPHYHYDRGICSSNEAANVDRVDPPEYIAPLASSLQITAALERPYDSLTRDDTVRCDHGQDHVQAHDPPSDATNSPEPRMEHHSEITSTANTSTTSVSPIEDTTHYTRSRDRDHWGKDSECYFSENNNLDFLSELPYHIHQWQSDTSHIHGNIDNDVVDHGGNYKLQVTFVGEPDHPEPSLLLAVSPCPEVPVKSHERRNQPDLPLRFCASRLPSAGGLAASECANQTAVEDVEAIQSYRSGPDETMRHRHWPPSGSRSIPHPLTDAAIQPLGAEASVFVQDNRAGTPLPTVLGKRSSRTSGTEKPLKGRAAALHQLSVEFPDYAESWSLIQNPVPTEELFQCQIQLCNQVIGYERQDITSHLSRSHQELLRGEKIICPWPVCTDKGVLTMSKTALSRHIQDVHSQLRYQCPFCSASANRKDSLVRHVLDNCNFVRDLKRGSEGSIDLPAQKRRKM